MKVFNVQMIQSQKDIESNGEQLTINLIYFMQNSSCND